MIITSKMNALSQKLAVIFATLVGFGVCFYLNWDLFIGLLHEWHERLHGLLYLHTNSIAQDPVKHGWALITLCFGYGIFHAIGPGHGKAIIVLYLSSHKESLTKGAVIALLAAMLQSVVAIVLVVALSFFLDLTLVEADSYADNVAVVSYLLVAALGAFLFLTALLKQYKFYKESVKKHQHSHVAEAQHGEHSCCDGHHVHQASPKETWLQSMGIIMSMGMRPCSGAIVVLVYAHLVGFFHYGIIATLVMGLETGLSVAGIALGTQIARDRFERLAKTRTQHSLFNFGQGYWLIMIGGLFIFIMGMSLFGYASP